MENIRLMPEFQKTMLGKNNVLAYQKAFTTRFDIQKYERNSLEVLNIGTRVVDIGIFTIALTLKSTDKVYELKGKYCLIWEKLGNDKLLLITEAWNYNHPVEIVDQLIFEQVPTINIALAAHVPVNDNISFELAAINGLTEDFISQHNAKM